MQSCKHCLHSIDGSKNQNFNSYVVLKYQKRWFNDALEQQKKGQGS